MRLYINGNNTRTIRMYSEAQVEAETGAHVEISVRRTDGVLLRSVVKPSWKAVDEALAGIEFLSALEAR